MANYRITIKINDYFPKIDAIPFDNYICVISCNNMSSKIKLTEYKYQYYQNNFKLQKNTDLLFNIKLINYLENNTLIGIYDLILPSTKVNQTLQRKKSFYQQQVKLIMNSNVKIKLFGTMMNITSIYLDLIFELLYIGNDPPSFQNKINKIRIYDIIGRSPIDNMDDIFEKNYSKKMINRNYINNSNSNVIQRLNQRSPNKIFNNKYFLDDISNKDLNSQKLNIYTPVNSNFNYNYNINNNIYNEPHSDINYNVMNNNYLNYFKIDNNSIPVNYKYNRNRQQQTHHSKEFSKSDIMEKLNKIIIPEKNNKNYTKINNTFREKRNDHYTNNNNRNFTTNIGRRNQQKNFNNYNNNKINYTKKKNDLDNLDMDIIRNDNKKVNLNQKYYKYQNTNYNNKSNKSNKKNTNYINYINTKQPILYDKKNFIEKLANNRLIKNINKSSKNEKDNNKNVRIIKDIEENNNNLTDLNENRIAMIKTPQKKRTQNIITDINKNNNNNHHHQSVESSNIKNIKECISELNNIENSKKTISLINSNYKNMKKNFFEKKEVTQNNKNKEKEKENDNDNDNDDLKNKNQNKTSINSINNNDALNESKQNINNKNENDINVNEKENENENENKNKNDNLIKDITPEDLKDQILKFIDDYNKYTKDIKDKINDNKKLFRKLLLCKEKYYTELKINNRLNNKNNTKEIKYLIHVNIRSKLNEKIFFEMKRIKIKEFKIFYKIFYEHKNSPAYKAMEAKRKIQEKLEQQKKVHILLKVIRELIQKFENLSQLYKDDEKKKLLFKSLLVRYGIREKEENEDNNLMNKFKEIKQKLEIEKNNNIMKVKKREMQADVYKNVIKEDSDEEKSSVSDSRLKKNILIKKKYLGLQMILFLKRKTIQKIVKLEIMMKIIVFFLLD